MSKKKSLSTDWLNSNPIFYSTNSNKFSNNMINLCQDDELSFDDEGLKNYLDFGYSVFQKTPIRSIKFLEPCRRIELDDNKFKIHKLNDPLDKYIDYKLNEDEIFELIKSKIKSWEDTLPSDQFILLPLSGGFDSRILLNLISNKDRVKAFSYGLSDDQSFSTEVVRAKYLCKKFKIEYYQIELGQYNNQISNWINLYGLSTHAHGMYHMEFYQKIKKLFPKHNFSVLSGIIGDLWAGSIQKYKIKDFNDINSLGLSRGLNAKSKYFKNNECETPNKKKFFLDNKDKLEDYRYQNIITARIKMILLSYLVNLPKIYGFDTYSPFLEIDVATSMLNLKEKRRYKREWQKDYLKKNDLYLEKLKIQGNNSNFLDINSARKNNHLLPLNYSLLGNKIEINYLQYINKNLYPSNRTYLFNKVLNTPKIGGALKKIGCKSNFLEAYYAYLCIYPIQYIMKNFKFKN